MNDQDARPTAGNAVVPKSATNALEIPGLSYALEPARNIDLTVLSPEQMQRVEQIASSVSFGDTRSLLTFGADPQRKLSQHLDALLDGIRTSDVGAAGDITIELATTIKSLHLDKMKTEVTEGQDGFIGALGRLPLVGSWISALRYLQLNHKAIKEHLDAIEARANGEMAKLNAMNDKQDRMVQESIDNIRELELYLAAAQVVVKRARADFEQRRQAAALSKDVVEVARLRDFAAQLNAFEARVVKMHIAHGQSMVSVPEIRASQEASRIEASNVMDSILFDLPNLKRAILRVASLDATSKASKANEARHELAKQVSAIATDELEAVYLKAKASQGGAEADVALLAQSADRLLQTIEAGARLDASNREKRAKAIDDLRDVKSKFTQALISSGDQFVSSKQ